MSDRIAPELVLQAYCAGAFPMADHRGRIRWFSPDPRCIIELDRFHVPRTLRKTVRRGVFELRSDTAFAEVIAACAERGEGTWISPRIIRLYTALHAMGFAHSVEAWKDGRLAGGLYGVAIGGAFFGESMFHRVTDASKVALVALVQRLRERGFGLLDNQWLTPHLARFGAVEIPREEYLRRLGHALELPVQW
ncbi:MAG TPA: leucyl/phenylalanyl-tRNA--protein transferase [Phycisphaerae bacterium]|nr:leucyl/phenylalanyl-tRNA--protein transferase [Phycisphaerae bacterium]